MTDAEFAQMFSKPHRLTDFDIVRHSKFTHGQLVRLCKHIAKHDNFHLRTLLDYHALDLEHIEILLKECVLAHDAHYVFIFFAYLEPRHIEIGLQHKEKIVREAAYNHSCCTDEQKVRYMLTRQQNTV